MVACWSLNHVVPWIWKGVIIKRTFLNYISMIEFCLLGVFFFLFIFFWIKPWRYLNLLLFYLMKGQTWWKDLNLFFWKKRFVECLNISLKQCCFECKSHKRDLHLHIWGCVGPSQFGTYGTFAMIRNKQKVMFTGAPHSAQHSIH